MSDDEAIPVCLNDPALANIVPFFRRASYAKAALQFGHAIDDAAQADVVVAGDAYSAASAVASAAWNTFEAAAIAAAKTGGVTFPHSGSISDAAIQELTDAIAHYHPEDSGLRAAQLDAFAAAAAAWDTLQVAEVKAEATGDAKVATGHIAAQTLQELKDAIARHYPEDSVLRAALLEGCFPDHVADALPAATPPRSPRGGYTPTTPIFSDSNSDSGEEVVPISPPHQRAGRRSPSPPSPTFGTPSPPPPLRTPPHY
jgi:hypothetical protein